MAGHCDRHDEASPAVGEVEVAIRPGLARNQRTRVNEKDSADNGGASSQASSWTCARSRISPTWRPTSLPTPRRTPATSRLGSAARVVCRPAGQRRKPRTQGPPCALAFAQVEPVAAFRPQRPPILQRGPSRSRVWCGPSAFLRSCRYAGFSPELGALSLGSSARAPIRRASMTLGGPLRGAPPLLSRFPLKGIPLRECGARISRSALSPAFWRTSRRKPAHTGETS